MASAGAERSTGAVEGLRGAGDWLQLLPRGGAALLAATWFAGISWLSSRPADPEPGPWWMAVLWNGGHAPLFGLLALWIALALPRRCGWPRLDRRGVGLVLAAVIACALADELHQSSTPGRDLSLLDLGTDLAGAASVLWIATFLADDRADDRGLARRVIGAALACTLAALSATFAGRHFHELTWL